jgi:hypothetical protein
MKRKNVAVVAKFKIYYLTFEARWMLVVSISDLDSLS